MSEIAKGDLVYVVRQCCDLWDNQILGVPFTVASVSYREIQCGKCGTVFRELFAFSESPFGRDCDRAPFSVLRKIDPNQASERDLEGAKLDEREKVPA